MTESHAPCGLVIEHQKLLGGISVNIDNIVNDVSYIRERVDNGLSHKVNLIEKHMTEAAANGKVRDAELRAENWFTRILTGSVTKIIGLVVVLLIVNALISGGVTTALKTMYWKEPPGQQKEILATQQTIVAAVATGYHTHVLADGRLLLHAGMESEPAWILDPKSNVWEKAPKMRTEVGIK